MYEKFMHQKYFNLHYNAARMYTACATEFQYSNF